MKTDCIVIQCFRFFDYIDLHSYCGSNITHKFANIFAYIANMLYICIVNQAGQNNEME